VFFHSYAKLPKGTFMGHGSSQGQSPDQRQPEVAPTSVPGSCGAFKGGFLVAWGTQQAEDRGFFSGIPNDIHDHSWKIEDQ